MGFFRALTLLSTFSLALVEATGGLNGLPVLNGPIQQVSANVLGAKSRVGDFVHPGLWHTHDDLESIRTGVVNNVDPWKTAYLNFSANSYSQSSVRRPVCSKRERSRC